MSEEAIRVRLGIAAKHARAALVFSFEQDGFEARNRQNLIVTAIESLEEAIDPGKEELKSLMEETPNA